MKTMRTAEAWRWAAASATMLAMLACGRVPVVEVEQPGDDNLREHLIAANRYIATGEATQIDSYAARRGWQTTTLDGGVRLRVERPGTGATIDFGDTLAVRYRVEDIAGRMLYDWQEETLVAGQMQPTRGFDVALRTLRRGSEATAMVPSEMAYGVVGDGDLIGTRMILIYKIKVNNQQ